MPKWLKYLLAGVLGFASGVAPTSPNAPPNWINGAAAAAVALGSLQTKKP